MKMVIVDPAGFFGKTVATALRRRGHEVLSASQEMGINIASGEGLKEVLTGAQVIVDLTTAAHGFDSLQKCCLKIISAASAAHVRHYVALSEVGTDLLDSPHFRAQAAREHLIQASEVPHTILRTTQFFEHLGRTDCYSSKGGTVRVAPACVQPVLSDEVAAALADLATSHARNSTLEMAGPERLRLDELVRQLLSTTHRSCEVVTDACARYFGARVHQGDLVPDDEEPIVGVTRFEEWLRRRPAPAIYPSGEWQ